MINLNELKVINAESNLEHGFFFVELDNGKSLQCCLKQHGSDDEGYYFANQIEVDNNGYSDGICADANEWAADEYEWGHIQDFLIDQARGSGVEIVA